MGNTSSIIFMNMGFAAVLAGLAMMMVQSIVRSCRRRLFVSMKPVPNCASFFPKRHETVEKEDKDRRVFSASFTSISGPVSAAIRGLTVEGAFVVCDRPLEPHSQITLSINHPESGFLVLEAKVVWNNGYLSDDAVKVRGMRVRFLRITSEARQTIENFNNSGLPTSDVRIAVNQPSCCPLMQYVNSVLPISVNIADTKPIASMLE